MIVRPRITEKATDNAARNVYVFDVHPKATKQDISSAIKRIYKVAPVRVNVSTIRPKHVVTRKGIKGVKQGGKKAYVFLKEGDTLAII